MLVEGTIRWQVTEDCPWDVLLALALRDLAGLDDVCAEMVPPVLPRPAASEEASARAGMLSGPADLSDVDRAALAAQWRGWWAGIILRETRPFMSPVRAPHFEVFDRALELQELLHRHYDTAMRWAIERHADYERSVLARGSTLPEVYRLVQRRQFVLRRQSNSFRIDLTVLPLTRRGGWVVAPDTIVVSASLRDDREAFTEWITPIVEALV